MQAYNNKKNSYYSLTIRKTRATIGIKKFFSTDRQSKITEDKSSAGKIFDSAFILSHICLFVKEKISYKWQEVRMGVRHQGAARKVTSNASVVDINTLRCVRN